MFIVSIQQDIFLSMKVGAVLPGKFFFKITDIRDFCQKKGNLSPTPLFYFIYML